MKDRFLFLLPRILVLALAIGLVSLLLAVVFKLLIAGIVIGGIVFIGAKVIKWIKHPHYHNHITQFPGFKNDKSSRSKGRTYSSDTIVPIY